MILLLLFAIPILGTIFCALLPRIASYLAPIFIFALSAITLFAYGVGESASNLEDYWLLEYRTGWFYIGLDNLSFVLLLTAQALSLLAVFVSWKKSSQQAFVLATLAGINGLLLSLDLLSFFVFWELMLFPIYFWIFAFGRERRMFAGLQFIIFTQISGLILLSSIIALYVYTGTLDINYLIEFPIPEQAKLWIAAGFMFAFLIKLPAFPFHTWLVGVFSEAPLAAVVSGMLLKTAVYGYLRFVLPIFPEATKAFAPFMIVLGAMSLIYGALLAFSQTSARKVLAYSTLSHAGLMLMALFSDNSLALNGVVVLMITQALSTAGLFMSLKNHLGFTLFFAMASLGLPGLGNFIGEWFILFGLFENHPWASALGAAGLVLSSAYLLKIIVKIYYGPDRLDKSCLYRFRFVGCSVAAALILWLGLFPSNLLDLTMPAWKEEVELSAQPGEVNTSEEADEQ